MGDKRVNQKIDPWQEIWETVDSYEYCLVTSHVGPDGDNIGSSMGFTLALRNMGKKALFILDDQPPAAVHRLLQAEVFCSSKEGQAFVQGKPYLLFALDCGNQERLAMAPSLMEKAEKWIVIDHHQSNDRYGDLNVVCPQISSTCQLIYQGLQERDPQLLTAEVASCLYTGMVTDTGRFLFGNDPAQTLRCAAALLEKGANRDEVMNSLYRNNSYNYMKLTGEVLSTLEVTGSVGWMYLTAEMLCRHHVDYNDTEMLVDHVINLEGVEIGLFAKEKNPGQYRISIRSKGQADVSLLAKRFGGGGHRAAAGCTIEKPLQEVKQDLFWGCKELYAMK